MYSEHIFTGPETWSTAANGTIRVIEIIPGQVACDITTPWGELDSIIFDSGECRIYAQNPPGKSHRYIVKVVSISGGAATFHVLSYVHDENLLSSQIHIAHNLPTTAPQNSIVNYDFTITNNSPGSIYLRYILASNLTNIPQITADSNVDCSNPLPPTTYRNKHCWYDDWVSLTPGCMQQFMPPGSNIHVTGSFTMPPSGIEQFVLGVFVNVPNYWPGGKSELVAPSNYDHGYATGITAVQEQCSGITCPDKCFTHDLYSQTVDLDTCSCIQGTLIQSNSPQCLTIGNIYFDSNPIGAEIWLAPYLQAPIYTGLQTQSTVIDLPAGVYSYILKRFNYEDYPAISSATIEVLANQTVSVYAPMIPIPGAVYQFGIKLDNETTGQYVADTIDKFADLLGSIILSKFSLMVSSVVYDPIARTVIIEIEDMPILSAGHLNTTYGATLQTEYVETLQRGRMETLRLEFPTFYNSHGISSDSNVKSLFLPLIAIIIAELLPYIAILIGWSIATILFGGPKTVSPTLSSLQITARMLTNGSQVVPIKDVTIEIAGLKLTANAGNGYLVTIPNLQIGKTYPVKAYISLAPGSKVYQASFDGNKTITDGMNLMTVTLKMDTITLRPIPWKLCNLKLNGNPMPIGTIIRVYRIKTSENGTPIFDTLGTTTSGSDFCSGTVEVPAYLLDSQILTQFISNSIDPSTPSPTLHPGDQTDVPTVDSEKNTITVTTETTLKNNIVADTIEIKDKATGLPIKSIVPTVNTTLISGIPPGTYEIVATKSGYKTSACSLALCEVTFTTEYLGSTSATIILESLVTTCKLTITVTDKYIKPPKTQTSISIDGAAGQVAPNGVLEIPEITAGAHTFTIKADGYKDIIDKSVTIGCTTIADAITFTLDQLVDIVTGSMNLTIDIGTVLDQKGSVHVDKGQSFIVKVSGDNGTEPIEIYDISKAPDLLVYTIPTGTGLTGTELVYNEDTTLELQAFQGCTIFRICSESSNVVSITVGTGSPKCAIPGPFGGCLVEQTTGYGIMLLAGLGLMAGMTIFGKGGGGTRIIERIPPHYTPPEIKKENV